MRKLVLFTLLVFLTVEITAQVPPKREYRAAWIASVANLDWPSGNGGTTESQKQQMINILDGLKELNFNVIVFQVRPECDALYESNYEPWSYWLTGQQGKAPDPFYDPLHFTIEEAHKRGIEVHAWFNPYRAERSVGANVLDAGHVVVENPEWTLTVGTFRMLNPGLQEARDYITDVVMDVVHRYDVDGVHFDDYFYPYEGIGNADHATFQAYPRGFTNISDWRRDNVNIFMAQVHDSIKAVKPHVKLGVSPFGIWKSGMPSGIVGMSSYSAIYCDPMDWMQRGKLDYLTPQMYWSYGGGQDYGKLLMWWADSVSQYNTHFYPGQAAYRINQFSNPNELPRQIQANRANSVAMGSTFFRARDGVLDNPRGFADTLRNNLYRNPALIPTLEWLDDIAPNPVTNIASNITEETGLGALTWDAPALNADEDSPYMYVVYKLDSPALTDSDLENSDNIEAVTGQQYVKLKTGNAGSTQYFYLASLDRNHNESSIEGPYEVSAPELPTLTFPEDGAPAVAKDVPLTWNYIPLTTEYDVQVAETETFQNATTVNFNGVQDTTKRPMFMDGEKTYYWRVKAKNPVGETSYTNHYSFTTGYPAETYLVYPEHTQTELDTSLTLRWATKDNATNYHVEVSTNKNFVGDVSTVDSAGIGDTVLTIDGLLQNKVYWWRVAAANEYGEGQWSETFGFKTGIITDVENENVVPVAFDLLQNYPNPFNPTTTIGYSIPEKTNVTLRVYDVLGRLVTTLVNQEVNAGYHEITFDGSNLASGIYIYQLQAGKVNVAKKLTLMK